MKLDNSLLQTTSRPGVEEGNAGLKKAAREFETLFARMMLKSMREAVPDSGMFSGAGKDLYQGMLDGEYAKALAGGNGLGIADMLVRQLGGAATSGAVDRSLPARPAADAAQADYNGPKDFVGKLWPAIREAATRKGVAAEGVLAQAALETGWGRHVPKRTDGESSHNLFGIKAGTSWRGPRVAKETLEFENGIAVKKREWFRAYPSREAAVDDYLRLLDKPRYAGVREAGASVDSFAAALQGAGYATDPEYAAKIRRLAGGETLQGALASFKQADERPITR